jgi:hypothetical protein
MRTQEIEYDEDNDPDPIIAGYRVFYPSGIAQYSATVFNVEDIPEIFRKMIEGNSAVCVREFTACRDASPGKTSFDHLGKWVKRVIWTFRGYRRPSGAAPSLMSQFALVEIVYDPARS